MTQQEAEQDAAATFVSTIRDKADLFVREGFRDDDGVWHDGPHRVELDAALDGLLAALAVAVRERDQARDALRLALRGLPDAMHPAIPAQFEDGLVCAQIVMQAALGDDDPGDVVSARAALAGDNQALHGKG